MIKSIAVSNFKSIINSSIKFPAFVTIAGENAVGKTNLIQSIKFLKSIILGLSTNDAQRKISLVPNELFNFTDKNTEFSIQTVIETKEEMEYEFYVKVSLKNGATVPPILLVNQERLTRLDKTLGSQIVYFREGNDFKEKGTTSFPLAVELNKLALSIYKNQDTDYVKYFFSNLVIPDFEDINNLNSIGIGKQGSTSSDLADILINLSHGKPEVYQDFLKITRKFMPYFSSFNEIPASNPSDESTKGNFLLVLAENNLKENLSMQSISAGDIRTLYLIASALSVENNSSLIIEEIENGIHPKRILDLVDQLETIARVKNLQIIFTTHSSMLINKMPVTKIIFAQKKVDTGTQFNLLTDSDQITKIRDFLENGGDITDYLNNLK